MEMTIDNNTETSCAFLDGDPKVLTTIKVEHVKIFTCNTTQQQGIPNVLDYGLHKITHTQKDVNLSLFSCNPNGTDRFIKRYQCKCGIKFVRESTLAAHSILHEPFPHVCDCGIGFYKKKALVHHKHLVHPSKLEWEAKINLKTKDIPDINKLENKTNSVKLKLRPSTSTLVHPSKPAWKPKDIPDTNKLKNTIEPPTLPITLTCNKPEPTIEVELKTVPEEKPINENNQFHCPICKKVLASKRGFQIHLNSHNREKPYKCEKCNKGYVQYNSLVVHMRKHIGIEDFKCTFCEKEFNNLSLLQSHERTHTGEKPYVCSYCGKAFSVRSTFNKHKRTHTEGITKQCHVCMKMFFSQNEVKRHFIAVHDKVKRFECDVCNKKFPEKGTLRKHYNNIHLGIKKYECDYCGVKQACKYNLKTHILKMHMNNKRCID